ncbi:MAG: hypothetical protein ACI8UG_002348, partial [Gammaproteobacteria bacterium]
VLTNGMPIREKVYNLKLAYQLITVIDHGF